jgi:hypothetical protein
VLKILERNSSSRTLIARSASGLSLIGRMSERMTSAECEEMYEAPGQT